MKRILVVLAVSLCMIGFVLWHETAPIREVNAAGCGVLTLNPITGKLDCAGSASSSSGTVTSVATTSPITGGTFTTTGTIACATCGVTGTGLQQFAATTSAQLAGVISDETGSGLLVFATTPTLTTPVLGVATATTINKYTLTAPASGATLAIADGKAFTASNTMTLSGTDAQTLNVTNAAKHSFGARFDGAGSALTANVTSVPARIPFACTIAGYSISVSPSGTATAKVWKIADGTAIPTVANVINTAGIAISSGTSTGIVATTSDFTTTTVAVNDIFIVTLTAVATAQQVEVNIQCNEN